MIDEDKKTKCPICRKDFYRDEMLFSHDCYGIPFRLLCYDCWKKVMKEKGYDGEYYTAEDENIDDN